MEKVDDIEKQLNNKLEKYKKRKYEKFQTLKANLEAKKAKGDEAKYRIDLNDYFKKKAGQLTCL